MELLAALTVTTIAFCFGAFVGYDFGVTAEMKRQTKREWEAWEKEKRRLKL